MQKTLFWMLLISLAVPAGAERHEAVLKKDYKGSYQREFATQFDRIRLLVNQAQLEVSSRLGLIQYREGFQYPMTIRFDEASPANLENALAFVSYSQRGADFEQELVVNLGELARFPTNIDTVFYHEMTHAVLNDAVGGQATFRIPRWLQEGLALYVSGEGDSRVEAAAGQLRRSLAHTLLFDLDGATYANAYPQYYLAVKYIIEKHSINALQGLVRELIEGKSIKEAIQDVTSLTWPQFEKNVKEYSLKNFQDYALPDHVIRR